MHTCGIAMAVVAWRCGWDKNSINFFSASGNGTPTVSDCSTTCVTKSSRGFFELSVQNVKMLEKSCSVVDSTVLSCLIVKTSVKLLVTLRNFYMLTFKGMDCWVKNFFDKIKNVNILTPTTFFNGEPGNLIFCTVAVPKLYSVVGEEACLKLLLVKRNSS